MSEVHIPVSYRAFCRIYKRLTRARPAPVREVGTPGESAEIALERAARLSDAHLLSVDIEDCAVQCGYAKWAFVKSDDVAFAGEFVGWCPGRGVGPSVDVLFVDTSQVLKPGRPGAPGETSEQERLWRPPNPESASSS